MAVVNMNNLINGKDSRWLQLEVCREFQRNKCTRPDTECKFAHPPANVEVQNGKVTACYDSIKGRCNRERPPCKYFHPPQHLKDQLLINGRNHLALKNALLQQMGISPGQSLVTGQVPTAVATNPYLGGLQQVGSTYSPFFTPGHIMMGHDPGVGSPLGCVQQTIVPQKMPRSDRLESLAPATLSLGGGGGTLGTLPNMAVPQGPQGPELGRKRPHDPTDQLLLMDMKSSVGSYYYENFAFPGMLPYKRAAGDKSGVPMYQPGAYQQLMQPYVPVSCEYTPASNSNLNVSAPTATSPPAPEPKEKAKLAAAALNYTGVSLNKQVARGFAYPFAPSYPMPPGMHHTLPSSYLMRPTYSMPNHAGQHMMANPLLMASVSQAPATSTSSTAIESDNNNLQPYKKLKTS